MNIAVDAMGGDFAPRAIVLGALEAARKLHAFERLFLVGHPDALRAEFDACGEACPDRIEIRPASEVIEMGESPAAAIRRKKDSSIGRAVDLVKSGEAQAVFSAGNTGAAVAATTLKLRTLEGVARPAIATIMPTRKGPFILIDAGANIDCSPEMLVQFAVMGSIYAEEILGIGKPSIGVLSIGGEETKGNEITKETFKRLKESGLNFKGNVEGHDLFEGDTDVAVCDGFVGNVVLKTSESVARAIRGWMKEEFTRNPVRMLGALLARHAFRALKQKADPANYGGAPLLGVNGICIIGHGSSSARAVFNGIRVASESVSHRINHLIVDRIARIKVKETA